MPCKSFDSLLARVRGAAPKTLVVAAAHDPHAMQAVFAAIRQLPLPFILVGNREKIDTIAAEMGWQIAPEQIVDAADDTDSAQKAVALVRQKQGDVLMKGALQTATLLKAVLDRENGIRGQAVMSHIAVLEVPAYHKLVAITDAGMNTHPDLTQKAAIAQNAVAFWRSLGCGVPKVAALAAVETVSDKMLETQDAAALAEEYRQSGREDYILEGPISFDLAASRESARIKGYQSQISGDVDIFLAPEITAANVLCKALQYWGGAKMAGCVLGARAPIVLTSRGASAEEKLLSILLCASAEEREAEA